MSQTTKIFLYHQRHRVVLQDTSGNYFSSRYRQVYTKDLIAHRGTDNQILIEFVNQDQKRSNITGKTFTARIISRTGDKLLIEKPLEAVNVLVGQAKLVLTEQELDSIPAGQAYFSIEQAENSLYEPVFVDDNSGSRGNINIVDSIMPSFVNSRTVTIPDPGTSLIYPSSELETDATDLHTFQLTLDQFSGTITVEGAPDTNGQWYTIDTLSLTLSDLELLNVDGFHPLIRFMIAPTTGTVSEIKYR